MSILWCILWIILCIISIIGSILPWIPWPQLAYIAILIAHFSDNLFSWKILIIRWIIIIIISILDYYLPILWTKKFWWWKRGNYGCITWMIVWLFVWPLWIIFWPFLWALTWEYLHKKSLQKWIKPAFWAFIGFLSWTILKVAVSIILFIHLCINYYNFFF